MLKPSLRKMSLDLHSGISKLLSSTLCDNVLSTEAQNSKKLVLSIDVICRTSLRISYMRLNEIRSKGNSTNDRQNLTKRDQERDANGSQYEVYILLVHLRVPASWRSKQAGRFAADKAG